jgi:hypothetical protein
MFIISVSANHSTNYPPNNELLYITTLNEQFQIIVLLKSHTIQHFPTTDDAAMPTESLVPLDVSYCCHLVVFFLTTTD